MLKILEYQNGRMLLQLCYYYHLMFFRNEYSQVEKNMADDDDVLLLKKQHAPIGEKIYITLRSCMCSS